MKAFIAAPVQIVWDRRALLATTIWTELQANYAGSVLGAAWTFGGPIMLMFLYAVMYGFVLHVRPASTSFAEYLLNVGVGLIPFMSFSSGVSIGATSLAKDKQILLNTYFPSELIGFRTVMVQAAPMAAGLAAAIVMALLIGNLRATVLLVPFVAMFQLMFTVALVWMLSLLTLALRDLQHVIQYAMFALLLVTPIGYDRSLVPPALKFLMYFNPFYYYVVCYQDLIVLGRIPEPSVLIVTALGSTVCFCASFAIFQRAKKIFYDYV